MLCLRTPRERQHPSSKAGEAFLGTTSSKLRAFPQNNGSCPLPISAFRQEGSCVWSLTCFDADVGAPDLAGSVLRGAEIVIVVDKAIEGGGGEGVELQRPIGVDVPDVRHVVDVVPRGQVPSKGRAGGARGRAGHHHPHGAGKGHLLQGVIYKVEAGADILRAGCRAGGERLVSHGAGSAGARSCNLQASAILRTLAGHCLYPPALAQGKKRQFLPYRGVQPSIGMARTPHSPRQAKATDRWPPPCYAGGSEATNPLLAFTPLEKHRLLR